MEACSECGKVCGSGIVENGLCDSCCPYAHCGTCSKRFRVNKLRRIFVTDISEREGGYQEQCCSDCERTYKFKCCECGRPPKRKYEIRATRKHLDDFYAIDTIYPICSLSCKCRLKRKIIAHGAGVDVTINNSDV